MKIVQSLVKRPMGTCCLVGPTKTKVAIHGNVPLIAHQSGRGSQVKAGSAQEESSTALFETGRLVQFSLMGSDSSVGFSPSKRSKTGRAPGREKNNAKREYAAGERVGVETHSLSGPAAMNAFRVMNSCLVEATSVYRLREIGAPFERAVPEDEIGRVSGREAL